MTAPLINYFIFGVLPNFLHYTTWRRQNLTVTFKISTTTLRHILDWLLLPHIALSHPWDFHPLNSTAVTPLRPGTNNIWTLAQNPLMFYNLLLLLLALI